MRSLSRIEGARLRIPPHEWFDLLVATYELARARIRLRRSAGQLLLAGQGKSHAPACGLARNRIGRVRTAVGRMSHRLPWRTDCLVQAVAAHHWLRRHGLESALEIGARERGEDPFEGHAWLLCGDTVVTGGDLKAYRPLRAPRR